MRFLIALSTMRTTTIAALLAAGCSRTVGSQGGREQIRDHYAAELGAVADVECPADIRAERGGRYQCTIRFAEGDGFAVAVEQQDDVGNVRFELIERPVATAKLAPAIRGWLKQQVGTDATVDCGRGVRKFPPTGVYPCTARLADGSQRTVGVSVDTDGSYRWNFL